MQPKTSKYRKEHRGRRKGISTRGSNVDFGEFGLPLNQGGNVVIDGTNNVTVVWALADNSQL